MTVSNFGMSIGNFIIVPFLGTGLSEEEEDAEEGGETEEEETEED